MDLNSAFTKAVKAYYKGEEMKEMKAASGKDLRYTKAYFDSIEEQFGLSEQKAKDQKALDKMKED